MSDYRISITYKDKRTSMLSSIEAYLGVNSTDLSVLLHMICSDPTTTQVSVANSLGYLKLADLTHVSKKIKEKFV
jgi:hypothetical protein